MTPCTKINFKWITEVSKNLNLQNIYNYVIELFYELMLGKDLFFRHNSKSTTHDRTH